MDCATLDLVWEVLGKKSHTGHTPVTHQSHTAKLTGTVGHEESNFLRRDLFSHHQVSKLNGYGHSLLVLATKIIAVSVWAEPPSRSTVVVSSN